MFAAAESAAFLGPLFGIVLFLILFTSLVWHAGAFIVERLHDRRLERKLHEDALNRRRRNANSQQ